MIQLRQYLSGRPVPEGAPLKCKAGFHKPGGPGSVGTMGFTCQGCGGFYAHNRDYSHLTTLGDAMIAAGDAKGALDMVEDAIGRDYGWDEHAEF